MLPNAGEYAARSESVAVYGLYGNIAGGAAYIQNQ